MVEEVALLHGDIDGLFSSLFSSSTPRIGKFPFAADGGEVARMDVVPMPPRDVYPFRSSLPSQTASTSVPASPPVAAAPVVAFLLTISLPPSPLPDDPHASTSKVGPS